MPILEKNKGLKSMSSVSTLRNQKKETTENQTKQKKGKTKMRAEINEIANRKIIGKLMKPKASS